MLCWNLRDMIYLQRLSATTDHERKPWSNQVEVSGYCCNKEMSHTSRSLQIEVYRASAYESSLVFDREIVIQFYKYWVEVL